METNLQVCVKVFQASNFNRVPEMGDTVFKIAGDVAAIVSAMSSLTGQI